VYRNAIAHAEERGRRVRIRLRLAGAPELAVLPWECLYDAPNFLALSDRTPLIRYLELPRRIRPLGVMGDLRILVIIASGADYPPLQVGEERVVIERALGKFTRQGMIDLEFLAPPTVQALQNALREKDYHVLHFIGHGDFDPNGGEGYLVFEDSHRQGDPVTGRELAVLLNDHDTLRLVTLNACNTAQRQTGDALTGVAAELIQHGVPAVIAMQAPIPDRIAVTFAHGFFGALADSYPVEAALSQGRQRIFVTKRSQNEVFWGVPVLFMRASDGDLFADPSLIYSPTRQIPRWLPFLGAGAAILLALAALILIAGTLIAPPPTPTPTLTPTLTPTIVEVCPDAPETRIAIDQSAQTTLPVGLRYEPGFQGNVILRVESGAVVTVGAGPVCMDGYQWWYVDVAGGVAGGWLVEAFAGTYFVEPLEGPAPVLTDTPTPQPCADALTSRVSIGERAFAQVAMGLRLEPGLLGAVRAQIEQSTPLKIMLGPECVDESYWWYVQVEGQSLEGWVMEGFDGEYFLGTCDEAAQPSLTLGALAYTQLTIGLRESPGFGGGVLQLVGTDSAVTVMQGPVCVDERWWWYVEANPPDADRVRGWALERFNDQPFLASSGATPTPSPTLTPSATPPP
jgi:hypothetical protein